MSYLECFGCGCYDNNGKPGQYDADCSDHDCPCHQKPEDRTALKEVEG